MSKLSLGVEKLAFKPESGAPLAQIARADAAIAEAITVTDAIELVQTTKALDEWARAVRGVEDHQHHTGVLLIRAKRNAGQRIAEAQERGEVARPGEPISQMSRTMTSELPATLAELGVSRNESSEWKRLASEWTDEAIKAAAEEMQRPSLAGIQQRSPGMFTSASPEWYTPTEIIERVVALFGTIDLDPCSNSGGEPRIPASKHYREADNGLDQQWRGKVYMNPPYGREIGAWVDKLADEFEYGNVSEAIALVPARTDTGWWAHLPASMVCFVTGRLSFSDHENPAPFPSAVCYLGKDVERFASEFLSLGLVYVRLETEAAA